jgi:hypothetical protein
MFFDLNKHVIGLKKKVWIIQEQDTGYMKKVRFF